MIHYFLIYRPHINQIKMLLYLEVVHQTVLTASLLADGEVVAECAGSVSAVHCVAHCIVVVAGGVPDDART